MAPKTLHLIGRTGERLREDGTMDAAAAPLLDMERGAAPGVVRDDSRAPQAQPSPNRAAGPRIALALLAAAGMIGGWRGRDRAAEEFRIAQGHVLRAAFGANAAGDHPSNLVMVTSARPGEGKSFAALNLAASIARQNDYAVLLVDADSKPDSLGRKLGLGGEAGLLDLAANTALDPDALMIRTEIEKLSVLPPGQAAEHAPDLFAARPLARLMREIASRSADRLVVIDAPPCLSSSDPSALSAIVGQTVFVVEAGGTQRAEVESALELIQACPAITLLLNKTANTGNSFGSYASYAARRPD